MYTIDDAKQYLRKNWTEGAGVDCPCCGQRVKLYRRKLHKVMAQMLVKLYEYDKENPKQYVHVSKIMITKTGPNDFSKLRFWGLVVQQDGENAFGGRTSGFWAITEKGRKFVEGKIDVEEAVYIYNNHKQKQYGDAERMINIKEALDDLFEYRQLQTKLPQQKAIGWLHDED